MGWTSGWRSRAELVEHLTRFQKSGPHEDGKSSTWEVLKKTFRGNNLWTVIERKDFQDGELVQADKFICLFMMQKFERDEWGYKDVSASMGPTYYNCPVSWFDEVPEDGQYDTEWRNTCRSEAAKVKAVTKLADGEEVYLPYELTFGDGGKASTFTVYKSTWKNRTTTYFRRPDGVVCRLSKAQQASLKRPEAPALPEIEEAFAH